MNTKHSFRKFLFFVFSFAIIIYGISTIFPAIQSTPFHRWSDKIALYLCVPLSIVITLYYLRFFLPKYKKKYRSAKFYLTLLALCSSLFLAAYLTESFGFYYATGNTFTHMHRFSGLYFRILLPALGLIGLAIPHKAGWILSLLFPCYIICKVFAGAIIPEDIPVHHPRLFYPYLIYGILFPSICNLPAVRTYFYVNTKKEWYYCFGAVILITTPFVVFTQHMNML